MTTLRCRKCLEQVEFWNFGTDSWRHVDIVLHVWENAETECKQILRTREDIYVANQ